MTKKEKEVLSRYFEETAMKFIRCSSDDIEQFKYYRAQVELLAQLKEDFENLEKVNIEVGA